MSGVVKFVIYHGYGVVCTTVAGADLSEFQFVELQLTDPQSIRIRQFKLVLVVFFGLNSEMYTISLQALWSNSYQYFLSFERDRAYHSVGRLVERVRASGNFPDRPSGCEAEAN
jgi:hypothetical protein